LEQFSSNSASATIEIDLHRWRVTWQQTRTQLQKLFFPTFAPNDAFRAAPTQAYDQIQSLLRSQVQVGGLHLEILLHAMQKAEDLEHLYPVATLTLLADQDHPAIEAAASAVIFTDLRLHLTWGAYQTSAAVHVLGKVNFPPLSLSTVLAPVIETITAPLALSLENNPA
jgi:hypothetical protein